MIQRVLQIVKYAVAVLAVAAIAAIALHFRGYFANPISILDTPPPPCSEPIVYSIGDFDARFGLSQAQFLADVNEAAQIWNRPFGKVFFQLATGTDSSAPRGQLKINLVYDYRQQATDAMNAVGSSIDDQSSVYDALNAKYKSLTDAYASEKASLAAITAFFQAAQASYNQEVDYWNSRGGAPADEYAKLGQEKSALQSQADSINDAESKLNASVDTINSTASTINKYVSLLNSEANQYNKIASSTGEQFDEGEYVEDASGKHIDIYQYDTQTKLIRVLAHELGHALGLGHIQDNPQAIMYPLNQASDLALTQEDIAVLDKVCGI